MTRTLVYLDGFPRLYAAASLKLEVCAGTMHPARDRFPRLYAAASLKRLRYARRPAGPVTGFPRLYAAASLKQKGVGAGLCGQSDVFRGFMPRPH